MRIKPIIGFLMLFISLLSCTAEKKAINTEEEQPKQNINVEQELSRIIGANDVSGIIKLIQGGMDPNIEIDNWPLIIKTARNESDALVITLVNNGANLYCNIDGDTFILMAVHRLKEETLFYILDRGFDIMRLSDKEIRDVFEGAIFKEKIEFQKRLLTIDGFIEKIMPYNNDLAVKFMWYWVDGTGEILETLTQKGFELPDDGSLYYHVVTENRNYKAVEWLIEQGFSMTIPFDGESIKYWADLNLSRKRKTYDDSDPLPEDSPIIINAKKIKELIDENADGEMPPYLKDEENQKL
jgi:hypothetical protein